MTSKHLPLAHRIALITGASSGIGQATARHFADLGAKVALVARRKDRIDALAAEINDRGGHALALAVDLTDRAAVQAAAGVIASELGRVDLVVNNAGLMLAAPIDSPANDDWQQMVDINIKGVLAVIEAFVAPLIASAEAGNRSDLINISSVAADGIFPRFGVYCGTKAFVTHLSKNLRAELGPKNVRVSVVEPGLVATELQGHVQDPGANAWLASARESITWLTADDIAHTLGFIAGLPRHVNIQDIAVLPTQQA